MDKVKQPMKDHLKNFPRLSDADTPKKRTNLALNPYFFDRNASYEDSRKPLDFYYNYPTLQPAFEYRNMKQVNKRDPFKIPDAVGSWLKETLSPPKFNYVKNISG